MATEKKNNTVLATEFTENTEELTNKTIINGNCWLAYFDILGFKEKVKRAENNNDDKYILNILTHFYDEKDLRIKFEAGLIHSILFSDTLILYSSNNSEECLSAIESSAREFSRIIFTANWHTNPDKKSWVGPIPFRGCLNYGRFYSDRKKDIYWGSALIEAYELAESQDWIGYIISENAMSQIKEFHSNYWKNIKPYYTKYDIPFKNANKKSADCLCNWTEKLYAYNYDLKNNRDDVEAGFIFMLSHNLANGQNKEIVKKYENTKKFLLGIYPDLMT